MSPDGGAAPWSRRRGALTHDWLKNRFCPSLGAALNSLDGRAVDPELEQLFFGRMLDEWPRVRIEAQQLIDEYAAHTSIDAKGSPDAREWVAMLDRALWYVRESVPARTAAASASVAAADTLFQQLTAALGATTDRGTLRPLVSSFGDSLQRLIVCMNDLPRHWADR